MHPPIVSKSTFVGNFHRLAHLGSKRSILHRILSWPRPPERFILCPIVSWPGHLNDEFLIWVFLGLGPPNEFFILAVAWADLQTFPKQIYLKGVLTVLVKGPWSVGFPGQRTAHHTLQYAYKRMVPSSPS